MTDKKYYLVPASDIAIGDSVYECDVSRITPPNPHGVNSLSDWLPMGVRVKLMGKVTSINQSEVQIFDGLRYARGDKRSVHHVIPVPSSSQYVVCRNARSYKPDTHNSMFTKAS